MTQDIGSGREMRLEMAVICHSGRNLIGRRRIFAWQTGKRNATYITNILLHNSED